jgi:hypothetical protein
MSKPTIVYSQDGQVLSESVLGTERSGGSGVGYPAGVELGLGLGKAPPYLVDNDVRDSGARGFPETMRRE